MELRDMKFKKIRRHDRLYLGDGLFSNGHWLFRVDWISAMNSRVTFGLRCALKRKCVEVATLRLKGEEVKSPDLQSLITRLDSFNYTRVKMSEVEPVMGYRKGEFTESVVSFRLKSGKRSCELDAEYFTALLFDPEIEIFIHKGKNPVVLRKNNEVIGLIMPLNPEQRAEYYKKGGTK